MSVELLSRRAFLAAAGAAGAAWLAVDPETLEATLVHARRMHETAFHLLDHVLPRVPYRQWGRPPAMRSSACGTTSARCDSGAMARRYHAAASHTGAVALLVPSAIAEADAGNGATITCTDSIVLDTVPPPVVEMTLTGASGTPVSAAPRTLSDVARERREGRKAVGGFSLWPPTSRVFGTILRSPIVNAKGWSAY